MASTVRVHLVVHGRVQGVGFRWFTAAAAQRLGVAGFVCNRADGTVELCAEGPASAITALEQTVAEGPSGAQVTRVAPVTPPSDEPLPHPFAIRRD